MLCAMNSDTVTVTYAGSLEYIDYRTFNLITLQYVFTLGMGMHFHRMGFSDGGFPTLDSIIDEELLHCVKSTIIIELMIWRV